MHDKRKSIYNVTQLAHTNPTIVLQKLQIKLFFQISVVFSTRCEKRIWRKTIISCMIDSLSSTGKLNKDFG